MEWVSGSPMRGALFCAALCAAAQRLLTEWKGAWLHLFARWIASLVAIFLIAGCAHQYWAKDPKGLQNTAWTGRLSLQVTSDPVQSFSAGFELTGDADQGSLLLTTPLGGTLAQMQWLPGHATLLAQNKTQHYASVEDILQQLTGAPIPMAALFDWLQGRSVQVPGWQADLSRLADGKISAQRSMPLPTAELRVVLDH